MKKISLLALLCFSFTAVRSMEIRQSTNVRSCFNACTAGDTEKVKDLITKGIDVNTRLGGDVVPLGFHNTTFLHWAAMKGHTDTVQLLLEHNAHVDAKAEDGRTPLMEACTQLRPDIVNILLQHNASLTDSTDPTLTTLLHCVCHGFCYSTSIKEIVKALAIIPLLTARGAHFGKLNNQWDTPLHWAAAANSPELILSLLGLHAITQEQKREARNRLCTFLLALNRYEACTDISFPNELREEIYAHMPIECYNAGMYDLRKALSAQEFATFTLTLDTPNRRGKRPCDIASDAATKKLLDPKTWQ